MRKKARKWNCIESFIFQNCFSYSDIQRAFSCGSISSSPDIILWFSEEDGWKKKKKILWTFLKSRCGKFMICFRQLCNDLVADDKVVGKKRIFRFQILHKTIFWLSAKNFLKWNFNQKKKKNAIKKFFKILSYRRICVTPSFRFRIRTNEKVWRANWSVFSARKNLSIRKISEAEYLGPTANNKSILQFR